MNDTQELLNMEVFIPLVVAHQFYRMFKSSQAENLVLLAADALNKTKPIDTLKARVAGRKPGEPDSLFLLNNMDCLQPLPNNAWPKRLMNKAKWGEFTPVMAGLELYLSNAGKLQELRLEPESIKALTALFAFATFDVEDELSALLVKALLVEQSRVSRVALGDK